MTHTHSHKRGVTLIEILLALSILALVGAVALSSLNQYRTQRSLDGSVESVLSLFSRAHLDTISSLGEDNQYGVHLDADKAVYFLGPTYTPEVLSNVEFALGSGVEIANISANISSSGNNVLFNRLTGGTDQDGSFQLRAKSNSAINVLVTVNGTGVISL
ncbi:MAG: hypothetical protein UY04_C0004G0010 [Parcubacteria group bacterium GW2011_GWA2_47_7]|nr:MAG: hypothetical protein UY04_C0004G0010 [Parcubacteria group bacterium GW2011_GWA2_47_7]